MQADYDILIVGGGLVGASLACALRNIPLRVGIVEAVGPPAMAGDDRSIALSLGSRRIIEGLGLWEAVAEQATPIRRIHVTDRGHFGRARLDAAEEGVDALGYVLQAAVLSRALAAELPRLPHAELIAPARLHALALGPDCAKAVVESGGAHREFTARLVVAADGERSRVRDLLAVQSWRVGYDQVAIVAVVQTDRPHRNEAFERFTDTGPLALLPLTGPERGTVWRGLVWTVHERQREEMLGLEDRAFLARLQERFGAAAGRLLAVGPRSAFSLTLQYVRQPVRDRLVFIGNAAHTVHPIAGQGFNLGLRDVAALAEVLADAAKRGADPGAMDSLAPYGRWRRSDYLRVIGLTDGLVRMFSTRSLPLVVARNVGMLSLDLVPAARHGLARLAMGLTGRLPRLARGLRLDWEELS